MPLDLSVSYNDDDDGPVNHRSVKNEPCRNAYIAIAECLGIIARPQYHLAAAIIQLCESHDSEEGMFDDLEDGLLAVCKEYVGAFDAFDEAKEENADE